MKELYNQFNNDEGILLASSCTFKPGVGVNCEGGVTDFASDDGSRRLLEQARHLENEVFPTYDLAGNRITPAHRFLACTPTFSGPDCAGDCNTCSGSEKPKCLARQLKCKALNTEGLKFPFSKCNHSIFVCLFVLERPLTISFSLLAVEDPFSVIGLMSGGDIELLEFRPPPLVFSFDYSITAVLWTPPVVQLVISFR